MATDRYNAPYLDSSVFIAWINRETIGGVNRFEIADHIINQAAAGKYTIYISALTLAEVNKIPRSKVAPLTPEQNEVLIKFFQNDYFKLLPVDRYIGEMANSFCRQYGIMGNDAIHLACALRAKCDVLLVWDRPLSKKAQHPSIRVEEPQILGQRAFPSINVAPPGQPGDASAQAPPAVVVVKDAGEPVQPPEPSEPAAPAEPPERSEPPEPAEPEEVSEPPDPAKPQQPVEPPIPTERQEPTVPAESTRPGEPAKPASASGG